MADFCTECDKITGLGTNGEPDINIRKIAEPLENGTYVPVMCEGCGLCGVGKDDNGNIIVIVPENIHDNENENVVVLLIDDFERDHSTKYWYHSQPHGENTATIYCDGDL